MILLFFTFSCLVVIEDLRPSSKRFCFDGFLDVLTAGLIGFDCIFGYVIIFKGSLGILITFFFLTLVTFSDALF